MCCRAGLVSRLRTSWSIEKRQRRHGLHSGFPEQKRRACPPPRDTSMQPGEQRLSEPADSQQLHLMHHLRPSLQISLKLFWEARLGSSTRESVSRLSCALHCLVFSTKKGPVNVSTHHFHIFILPSYFLATYLCVCVRVCVCVCCCMPVRVCICVAASSFWSAVLLLLSSCNVYTSSSTSPWVLFFVTNLVNKLSKTRTLGCTSHLISFFLKW